MVATQQRSRVVVTSFIGRLKKKQIIHQSKEQKSSRRTAGKQIFKWNLFNDCCL